MMFLFKFMCRQTTTKNKQTKIEKNLFNLHLVKQDTQICEQKKMFNVKLFNKNKMVNKERIKNRKPIGHFFYQFDFIDF